MKRVIVTGGTGVTGNALVRYLLQQNILVTLIVRPNSNRKRFLPQDDAGLQILECDLTNLETLSNQLEKDCYDAFFHLAWDGSTGKQKVGNRNNFKMQNRNVSCALDAVELCYAIGCPVFLMTGSQAEYGRKTQLVQEEMDKQPENGYGMAKMCAEGMTRLLCKEYGIRHIWPILFSVYGPNDATESLIDTSIRKLLNGETLPYTAGEQEWDYIYSYDAAKALVLLAQNGRDGEAYHVANGKTRRLREYIQIIYQIVAPEMNPRIGELPYANNQVMFLGADISKLQREIGFVPEYSFECGIKKIVESIQAEKEVKNGII